ncbi:hypothetical protein EJ04DRAFT_516476 [Polyplosphaeria fusca]|uniref:Uncharacterized protein n=1 Tax=Polyplosphaeria fusca TaxID=682080 RepID=A0A9P4QNH1_9PLEO|nr:hypothetical protein EJ04DRAFT_516476 [Polyplosphaeria fusca]
MAYAERFSPTPFVCPVCIENWTRKQLSRYAYTAPRLSDLQKSSFELTSEFETEVAIWTFRLVERLTINTRCDVMLRAAEGVNGVYRFKDVERYIEMEPVNANMAMSVDFTGTQVNFDLQHIPRRKRRAPRRNRSQSQSQRQSKGDPGVQNKGPGVPNQGDPSVQNEGEEHHRYRSPIRTRAVQRRINEVKLNKDIDDLANALMEFNVEENKGDALLNKLLRDMEGVSLS